MKPLTHENFKDIKSSKSLVVIKAWAPWCQPCRKIAPVLDKIEKANTDSSILFYHLDVDVYADLAAEFNISAIPTIIFINGNLYDRLVGIPSENDIKDKIDEMLK